MDRIIDFCGRCGILLPIEMEYLHRDEQHCGNCGHAVAGKDARIQGRFEEAQAERLLIALGEI